MSALAAGDRCDVVAVADAAPAGSCAALFAGGDGRSVCVPSHSVGILLYDGRNRLEPLITQAHKKVVCHRTLTIISLCILTCSTRINCPFGAISP